MALLLDQVEVSDVDLFAYAVMPNHFHLVVRQGEDPLPYLMQPFLSKVAAAVQVASGARGHIFERRYYDSFCGDPGYLRNAIVYTHLNPLRAGLAGPDGDYRWSSRGAWLGTGSHAGEGASPLALELAAPLFANEPGRPANGLRRAYRAFEVWRIAQDERRDAHAVAQTGATVGPPPTEVGDRYWLDVIGPSPGRRGRSAGRPPWRGQQSDLSAIARQAITEVDPRLSPAIVRSALGGRDYVRARHAIIRRGAAAGFRRTQIARYLRISPSTVTKVLLVGGSGAAGPA